MRIIPGRTKVQIELFKNVSLLDMLVGLGWGIIVVLTMASSIPYNWVFAIIEALVAVALIARIDKEANYIYLMNMLKHFAYHRNYEKMYSSEELMQIYEDGYNETAFQDVFIKAMEDDNPVKETKAERKERLKREKAEYKADTKLLKSGKLTKEEEDAIWLKRANASAEKKERKADAKSNRSDWMEIEQISAFTGIEEEFIAFGNKYYGAVLEIPPIEFRFFSQRRRDNAVENALGSILRSSKHDFAVNIVKIERPVNFEKYVANEYDKLDELRSSFEQGMISEEELKARVEVVYDRINELLSYGDKQKVIIPFYYIVLFDSDKQQLNNAVDSAMVSLRQGEMDPKRLRGKDLAIFLKYTNELDFDEEEIDNIRPEDYTLWAMPDTVEMKHRTVQVNHMMTHNMRVVNYPGVVGDAWLASLMTIPSTKVVIKATPMDRGKSISAIDRSLTELRAKYTTAKTDSEVIDLQTHIETLQTLLVMLQSENEGLLNVNIYVTAYDAQGTVDDPKMKNFDYTTFRSRTVNMKKNVRRLYQEQGFRLNNLEFNQTKAYIASQVSGYDPFLSDGRGMPSNTVAAAFPWVFSNIMDDKGFKLGQVGGVPVFIDFFRRDSERVNSNMVIVGKSGSGKSYATKSLLTNLAADDSKIFILDPENEYTELAKNLNGKYINVANAKYGRLNPFHIITDLEDDEAEDIGEGSSYATHLQFLEEFFKQILPDCDKDALEYLNSLVDRTYQNKDIGQETDLSALKPEDYPVFDDLYDEILKEFQRTDNEYIRTMLRTLMNHISKFSTGGRNAGIWNGASTITTEENFTVFNFQSLLANRNGTVANAQMLLVLKYIDNEIIKNREYNEKYGLNRKIVVVIDEAHVFIDNKYPVALDFMYQLAKRIRKYNGMQIVITQNIKDFVGSEEIARKSSAIINACQYSFIFSLAPNDMQDLCKLYEKAGGINENEQEEILQAPRGQAFTIMSPTSRSTFMVTVPDEVRDMFTQAGFQSNYFVGEEGQANWEDYIEDSREKRNEILAKQQEIKAQEAEHKRESKKASKVIFSEITEEELAALHKAAEAESAPAEHDDKPAAIPDDFDFDFDIPESPEDFAALMASNSQPAAEPATEVKAPVAVEPEAVQTVQPQIIVQAPQTSGKVEEMLTELLSKLTYPAMKDEIKRAIMDEIGANVQQPVASPEPAVMASVAEIQPAAEEKPAAVSHKSIFDIAEEDDSADESLLDMFGDLFSDTDKEESSQAIGNIFDLASDSSSDTDNDFDILGFLQAEAAKIDQISPIDEMLEYGQLICDVTLEQLMAYTSRERI